MFGLFKSATFHDPHLGVLTRSGGKWKGAIALEGDEEVPLAVSGDRKAPDASSLSLARELPVKLKDLKPRIAASLFEHYEPYRDAASRSDLPQTAEPFPSIADASGVWRHVTPVAVNIEPLRGAPSSGPTVEIAYAVTWDEEHTVGARIQDWRLFELCGSI